MSDSMRVLVVEDNPGDADLLVETLPRGGATQYAVTCVERLSEALAAVAAERFDIVMLDLGLPDSDGLATFRIMRRQAAALPIIVLTGNSSEQTALEAIREGAQDYLLKGEMDGSLLVRSIKYAVERKQAENALQKMNETLEERVLERTESLLMEIAERVQAQEALRRAKEVAEAATLAKSRFLANMSHELRTPMTGVLGMLDLLLLSDLEAEQREYVETAQTASRSLVRILNDILDLTKIEMGKLSLEHNPFSIRECVGNTHNILLPLANSKGLEFVSTVADAVPETLVGDKSRLNQVLTNLAGNAVKFTDAGKVEMHVALGGRASGNRREVSFTVTDTGIGIPDGKKELLFRSFSQVDESHSRRFGGTGLGLAICREIVESMGGTIGCLSAEGKGSTFFCTIPFAGAETGLAASVEAATHSESHSQPADQSRDSEGTVVGEPPHGAGTTKTRLLVAEDDLIITQILGKMLEKANFEIEFAENGEQVVEMSENGAYDLILMDVQMPGMNGFEATGAIRQRESSRGGHIPIVAMTAHALSEDQDRCLEAGMDSYIAKPIDFKKALQVIGETLNNRQAAG